MNKAIHRLQSTAVTPVSQRGVITTLTGVLILFMLGLMMFFAMRVGVFEQRVSTNEVRQKLAFHTAESGIQHAKEFFLANGPLLVSDQVDVLTNGADGWLADTVDKRWQKCSEAGLDLALGHGTHPCFGESAVDQRGATYYYSFNNSTQLPLNTTGDTTGDIIQGSTEAVTVEALLCMLELDEDAAVPVQGCNTDRAIADGSYFMITMLARGQADCDGGSCNAEALVSDQIANFGATGGGNSPQVPLTVKGSFPPSGTVEVAANPNAGGTGVPISLWMNNNTSCSSGEVFDPSSGSWATCEMHEWYGVDTRPDDLLCTLGTCSCSQAEAMSYTDGNTTVMGIDLVLDDNFPCDLFQFYFGVPRSNYQSVKAYSKIISDCDSLGADSFGIYWVSGPACHITAGTTIGSPDHPVLLISAASETRFNGVANLFGVLFLTDVEDANAELVTLGTLTVYGSVINDATLGSYLGTFIVVWAEDVTEKAGNSGGLGSVIGGWSDFHRDWE